MTIICFNEKSLRINNINAKAINSYSTILMIVHIKSVLYKYIILIALKNII